MKGSKSPTRKQHMDTLVNALGIFGILLTIAIIIAAIIMPLVVIAINSKLTAILKIMRNHTKK
jgi:hypothetical protein